jgi:hypothetical protein
LNLKYLLIDLALEKIEELLGIPKGVIIVVIEDSDVFKEKKCNACYVGINNTIYLSKSWINNETTLPRDLIFILMEKCRCAYQYMVSFHTKTLPITESLFTIEEWRKEIDLQKDTNNAYLSLVLYKDTLKWTSQNIDLIASYINEKIDSSDDLFKGDLGITIFD